MAWSHGVADVNGARLAYARSGEGPSLVLIHGFTLDRRMWDAVAPRLAARYSVLRYDLRGFGESDPPRIGEAYTHAADLHALLGDLGIDRAAVAGLSLGGWVALEYALTYPDTVSKLVLIDAALRNHVYRPELSALIGDVYRLGREGRHDEAMERWLAASIFATTANDAVNAPLLREMVAGYSGWHLRHDDPHPPLPVSARERLDEVAAPTLVMVGEHDLPDYQEIAELLAGSIPNARKVVIAGAGHMAPMDAPDAVARSLEEFLG